MSYIVGSNMCGYLLHDEPIVVDTLAEAKAAVKAIADDYREYGAVRVVTPLRNITKRTLLKNYEAVYAYASDDTIAIWIAIDR